MSAESRARQEVLEKIWSESKVTEYEDGYGYFKFVELLDRFGDIFYDEFGRNMSFVDMKSLLNVYEDIMLVWPIEWQFSFWTLDFLQHPVKLSPARKKAILEQVDCEKEEQLLDQRANMPKGIIHTGHSLMDVDFYKIPKWRRVFQKEVSDKMLETYGCESEEWQSYARGNNDFLFLPLTLWPRELIESYTWYADVQGRPITHNDGEIRRLIKLFCRI